MASFFLENKTGRRLTLPNGLGPSLGPYKTKTIDVPSVVIDNEDVQTLIRKGSLRVTASEDLSVSAEIQVPTLAMASGGGGSPTGPAGGDLSGTYPDPSIAPLAVTAAKVALSTLTDAQVAAANKDGIAATPSMRTLGVTSTSACAGDDARLSDSRAPTGSASGDLSGTYPGPAVSAITTTTGPTSLTIGAVTDGQFLKRSANTVVGVQLLSDAAPADVTKAAASAGVSTDASRADHKHDITTASASALTPGQSSSEGSATSIARSDHGHALPGFGTTSGTFTEGNDVRIPPTPVGQNGETIFSNNTVWESRVIGQTDIQTPAETIANAQINQLVAGKNLARSGTSPALTFAYSPTSLTLGSVVTDTLSADANDYSPTGWNGTEPAQAVFLDIAGDIAVKITGLAGGVEGRLAIIRRTGSTLLMIPPNDTGSVASNRFAGNLPSFLMPGDVVQFVYRGTQWVRACIRTDGDDFDNWEDFSNTTSSLNALVTSGGTLFASAFLAGTSPDFPIGIVSGSVAAVADRAAYRIATGGPVRPTSCAIMTLHRVSPSAVQDGSNTYTVRVGIGDAETASVPTDGVYWVFNNSSANWQFGVAAAAVASNTASSIAVSFSEYIWLGVALNAAGTRADYFAKTVSGLWVFAGSKTTGIPSVSQTSNIQYVIAKTLGSASRTCDIDVFAYRYNSQLVRG
jgi:hypothetical protein